MLVRILSIIFLVFLSQVGHSQVELNKTDTLAITSPLALSMERGKVIYNVSCITCHKAGGEGRAKFFPPLAASDYLINNRTASIKAVKYGQREKINVNGMEYNGIMPNPGLSDEKIADVMNYILNSWGNKSDKMVTVDEVISIVK